MWSAASWTPPVLLLRVTGPLMVLAQMLSVAAPSERSGPLAMIAGPDRDFLLVQRRGDLSRAVTVQHEGQRAGLVRAAPIRRTPGTARISLMAYSSR